MAFNNLAGRRKFYWFWPLELSKLYVFIQNMQLYGSWNHLRKLESFLLTSPGKYLVSVALLILESE